MTALAWGYIGEVTITPRPISDAVHLACTGLRLWSGIVYYYGTSDAELDDLFGYATHTTTGGMMKIELNSAAIKEAIGASADKAVADALSGYQVQRAIAAVVTEEVAQGAIAEAVRIAVRQLDTSSLTQHLAEELQKSTVRAATVLLQEALLQTVCRLRGIGSDGYYSDEDKREQSRIREELFKK
jgi:hypothetical protein